jgi:hypothetical protein
MHRPSTRITFLQILVAVVVVMVLYSLSIRSLRIVTSMGPELGEMNKIRQLQLATVQMTLDSVTTGDPIQWTCSNTTPLSYKQWYDLLAGTYMATNDMVKMTTYRAERPYWFPIVATNAITVYAVTSEDPTNTVLFSTANWQGPYSTNLSDRVPLDKHFIICQKGGNAVVVRGQSSFTSGDIMVFPESYSTNTVKLGSGGMHNYLPLK